MVDELRVGILGAAKIAGTALASPAKTVGGVTVTAIAARSREHADEFARKHGIPAARAGYESVLADPEIDAVYIPLPNGLHGRWMRSAIEAGKHVLCEKPFTANADEAASVAAAAADSGLIVMEAFHYRYHPLTRRILEIVRSGTLGRLETVNATLCVPMPPGRNIRWQSGLAGGTTMDLGCYAVHMLRTVTGEEPIVRAARAKVIRGDLDRCMRAELDFPSGITGELTVSMWSARLLSLHLDVRGSLGTMRVRNPLSPQYLARLSVNAGGIRRTEGTSHRPSYAFQLEAFRDAVRDGTTPLTGPDDAVLNMQTIDAIYRAAGLQPRSPSS
jgi:predicted dehydrogenase